MVTCNESSLSRLGQWLLSWIQPNGAIHGFHNHPIWGTNPYRTLDFTCAHSTFASPLMMALVPLLQACPDHRGRELLQRLVRFQTDSVRDDGQFKHIGFQLGESCSIGLIHNAVPSLALGFVALHGGDLLDAGQRDAIADRLRAGIDALDRLYPNDSSGFGTCNQEYARTWARMLYSQAFEDRRWSDRSRRELHQFITDFHRSGWPDDQCSGTLRSRSDPKETFEPAEYYGLMIEPLLLGYQIYGHHIFLQQALALARHVVRSCWQDSAGQTRLHRQWIKLGASYQKINQPMCIAGSGITASALVSLLEIQPDAEIAAFVQNLSRTYAHYQHPAGFFLSATGWHSELDVVPSSAWHSHDFLFLARNARPDATFWDTLFSRASRTAVLLGDQCFYVERGAHWAVGDYLTQGTYRLRGRKDRSRFHLQHREWNTAESPIPEEYQFPDLPEFWRTDDSIVQVGGDASSIDLMSPEGIPVRQLNAEKP